MKYIGYFKDINNVPFRIELVSQHDSSTTTEIRLAEEPITTTWSGNDENIYEPLRASESTIRIITDRPMLDLYSAEAMGTSVKLFNNRTGEIQWMGFVEPQIYDQDWDSETDVLELNCLDYVAILQYIGYDDITDGKQIDTFKNIFYKIFNFNTENPINHIYIADSLSIDYRGSNKRDFSISQHNFFDEDGVAMNCDEVVEEICRYLNFSVTQFKDSIYFLDWDSIKSNSYVCYNEQGSQINFSDIRNISKNDYCDSGSTISLSPVYNKVTVKDDLYPVEDIFPTLDDDSSNWGGKGHVQIVKTPYGLVQDWSHKSYFQFFKNAYCTSYYYFMDGDLSSQGSLIPRWNSPITDKSTVNYDTLRRHVGGTLLAHKCENYDANKDEPANLSLTNMLLLHCHDKFPTGDKPLFNVNYDGVEFYAGKNTYLIIKGTAVFLDDVDDGNHGHAVSEMILDTEHKRKKDNFNQDRLYVEVVLKVNGKYWNGTSWNNSYCTFQMPFQFDDKNNDHFIGSDIPIKNNISWQDNIDSEGFKILMPAGQLNSSVEVEFLAPKQRIDDSYRLESIWIKNFDIEFKVADVDNTSLVTDKEKNTDTEYTNNINDSYVKEMDEITFKVCTYDDKSANYSSVYSGNNFVSIVYHDALNECMRMEEQLIHKLVNQYSTPNIILDLNLYNNYRPYTVYRTHLFPNKSFIIDSSTINWEMNQSTLHLIEKK